MNIEFFYEPGFGSLQHRLLRRTLVRFVLYGTVATNELTVQECDATKAQFIFFSRAQKKFLLLQHAFHKLTKHLIRAVNNYLKTVIADIREICFYIRLLQYYGFGD